MIKILDYILGFFVCMLPAISLYLYFFSGRKQGKRK